MYYFVCEMCMGEGGQKRCQVLNLLAFSHLALPSLKETTNNIDRRLKGN